MRFRLKACARIALTAGAAAGVAFLYLIPSASNTADDQTEAAAPAATCPCVNEYAAAVRAFNELPGAPLTTWLRCSDMAAGYGGLIGYMTKEHAQPDRWMTVILVSKGRMGYGKKIEIVRRCQAWMYEGLAGDYGRPPLGPPDYGGHAGLSKAEVQACARVIEATAKCPD